MPVKRCVLKGEEGFKWGDLGKCYTGKNAKTKALAQGAAIAIAESKEKNRKNDKR